MKPIGHKVAEDVVSLRLAISNICFVGYRNHWVLVDTGVPGSANKIWQAAQTLYGENCCPKAIILTHGHFDHIGAVKKLARYWNVPVYAHMLELSFLTGQANYSPPDSSSGGLIAPLAPFYPGKSVHLGHYTRPLPEHGRIAEMPGWRWIHTSGHTAGHISLFRDSDGILIAGDAFTTVKQDSILSILTQYKKIHGPPAYYTTDWQAAWKSVTNLEALKPSAAITGHELPMFGKKLAHQLKALARHFDRLAIPEA
ncbi:MBL fold metallo-hydrolase [Bacillus sp. 165]|uniref:MBL fold metallo-hydrolase n=1 Tax=Bacillus sp. 165 TaxID=1529117 RepID=UPI001ADACD3A|nr:MBL fold metallo-hydrolase [Bacillus sp. 165]